MKATVIWNPAANSGRDVSGRLDAVGRRMAALGWEVVRVTTPSPREPFEWRQAVLSSASMLIAAGGDGTVHEVVTGLAGVDGWGADRVLGVLPLGTGNDVAKLLGIPNDEAFLRAVEANRPVAVDTLEVRCRREGETVTRHGVLFAAVGFGTELVRQTTPGLKRWLGPNLCYSAGFFRAVWTHRTVGMRVTGDSLSFEGPCLLACAANAPHSGGGLMQIGPGASMCDGRMNVSVIRESARWDVLSQFPRLLRGTHVRHPNVTYREQTHVRIETDVPVGVAVDGEIVGETPAEIRVSAGSIRMLTQSGRVV